MFTNHFIIFSRLYTFSICAQYIVNKYCLGISKKALKYNTL